MPFLFFQIKAQDVGSKEDTTVNLNEVVITASKIPLTQKETAKPVKVISRNQIERNFGKDLSQLLNEQAGIIINNAYSNPSSSKGVFLRGASGQYTLILVDGQPIQDPSGVGGAFDPRLFPLEQIERIEILKGSQSTLYGTDAIAGVINIISKKNLDDPIGVFGAASYGSLNTLKANLGLGGKTDMLDYNLSYQRDQTDGISEAEDQTGDQNFDEDGFSQNTFQANIGITPLEGLRISPFVSYSDYDADFDGGAFTDGENTFETELFNTGVKTQFQGERFLLNANYSYAQTDRDFISPFFESAFKGRFHNADVFGSFGLNENIKLIGGLQFQHLKSLDTTGTIANPSFNITSPYLTLLVSDLNGLSLELGTRLNNHTLFGNQMTYSIAPAYQISDQWRVFGSYTTGFKTPTLFELYGNFGANEELQPQRSATWEAGVQFDLPQKGLQASLTYFQRQIEDIIIFNFATGYINQDQQDDYGLEVELTWTLNEKVDIRANYSFVDGELTTKTAAEQDTSFSNLIRRPKHSFSLGLDYRPIPDLFLGVQGHYFGDRTDNFFNPDNFFIAEEVDLDAYFLLNFYAEYKLLDGKLSLFADVKNALDTDFTEVYGFNTIGFNIQSGIRFRL